MHITRVHKFKMPYQCKVRGINWIMNRIVTLVENILIRHCDVRGCVKSTDRQSDVIISFTTYPKRLDKVKWTIKSLLNQTVNVDKIILWLAEEQYPNREIPEEIAQYIQYGLQVEFCHDLKSHKKYYYTMINNPDSIVITVDDDVIYPEDTVEKLLDMHDSYPNAVICNMGRWIQITENGFAPYKKWSPNISNKINEPSFSLLPIGEGGILYPPHCIDKTFFNVDNITKYALTADDLWLKFAEVSQGTKAIVSSPYQRGMCEVIVKGQEENGLNVLNVAQGKNDTVIKTLHQKYPEVYSKIING